MFKINMVLHAIYVMHFTINMSGVENMVENYQSYWVACCAVMVFESCETLFFRFVTRISISLQIFMLIYAFTHIFSLRILLLAVENV